MTHRLSILLAGALVAGGLAVTAAAARSGHSSRPAVTTRFVPEITNPYLPYRPGNVWVYRGVKDGVSQKDVVRVTHRTRLIMGVRCTAITDVATHGARPLERTTDWYAQDRAGNVWYFGEATAAYGANGTVDRSGSWLAGVHGARPGIVMTAHPRVGDAHRQEYWPGHAEDQYWLVALGQRVHVPAGSYAGAARTLEWSRLEPTVIDEKFYVRGVGVVRETAAQGPPEVASLVRMVRSAGS
jgi:hypothetical protein